jgi:alpha-glucoside transport system substrate-binding protein
MKRHRFVLAALVVAAPLALVAAGCGGGGGGGGTTAATSGGGGTTGGSSVSGTVNFDGVWTGAEATHFAAVVKAFNQQYPNVKVKYKPVGDNLPTVISTAVAGGHPPDMASVAQPGFVKQLVDKGALQPIEYARSSFSSNFAPSWLQLGTFSGKLYGIVFKAANKSTVWYNVHAFDDAGVKAPTSFTDMGKAAQTIAQSGVPPFAVGGADGWTLTDLFENIYLRQAGADMYNKLSAHKIKWTDASVKKALTTMQALFQSGMMYGGTSGALQTGFADSVNLVFQNPPKAAMIVEGDFVPGVATVKATAGTDYDEFAFPNIGGSAPSVEIGGDTVVTFNDTPATEALVKFLTTSDAAAAWAKFGGFATGNKNMDTSVYPDAITKKTAGAIAEAQNVVFDMSDQQPASFGATQGQGEWGIFQNFLQNPSDVNGIAQKLESAAAAAYKNGS